MIKDLPTVRQLVKEILSNEIEARNNDDLLVALVDARCDERVLYVPYAEVLRHRSAYRLYPIESITRSRREIQHDHPELKGVDYVTRRRNRREKEFREYYRKKKKDAKR